MGIQGMLSSLKNNKRNRKSVFDNKKDVRKPNINDFVDHKKMTEYEFHELQKKLKKDNAERQKTYLTKSVLSISLLVIIVIYFLFFFKT